MIDWKTKLASRKLWAMVAGLATAVGVIYGMPTSGLAQMVAVIGAFGSIITYIMGESSVDTARAGAPQIIGAEINALEYKVGNTEPVEPAPRVEN